MNGRSAGPLSPVSIGGGSEWSGISKYQGADNESQDSPIGRGQLASPPISSGSNGIMNGGNFSRGQGADSPSNNPSPPASIARSSIPGSLYNGTTLNTPSESGRSRKEDQFEGTLAEHYAALKRYLAASLRDEKGNPRPNKARDKLLRLSYVQFQELSTDVFDELLRRQAAGRRTPNGKQTEAGPPEFLLPKDTFHPKRNQARQKLSTLPPPRFRDLATDVFYELERRFPRFVGGDISRTDSPASIRGPPSRSGNGTPIDPTMRPGSRAGPRLRRPSEASSLHHNARTDSRSGSAMGGPTYANGVPPSPGMAPSDYGRPQVKTFQSNTIVPNKSTMVEDDDDTPDDNEDEDGDAFALEDAARSRERERSAVPSETEKKLIEEYQTQVTDLREKLEGLEEKLRQKDDQLEKVMDEQRNRATTANVNEREWSDLQTKLEDQLVDVQNLNASLQTQLDKARLDHSNLERDMRAQIEEVRLPARDGRELNSGNDELERENEELRNELKDQQEVTEEVRREAQDFLMEMRQLTERSGSAWERESQLSEQVNRLEEEVKDWRDRYAKTKTQLRALRASSIGLTIHHDAAKYARESGFTQDDGLVKDIYVTKFQISIDELLGTARTGDPTRVVDFMKNVVVNVRNITKDIDESSVNINPEASKLQMRLKSKVSATANNLITASKNFASAKGVSPLSLLDAAASHLTEAVVELIRTVKIRPTPAGELEDDDDGTMLAAETIISQPFLGLRSRESAVSSTYSPANSPRQSGVPAPRNSSGRDWSSRRPSSRSATGANGVNGLANGSNGMNTIKGLVPAGYAVRAQDNDIEDLKIYLEDQTALLVQTIQSLVSSIRSEAGMTAITTELGAIASVVGKVVGSTESAISSTRNAELSVQSEPIVKKLSACRQKLVAAGERGEELATMEDEDSGRGEMEWRVWTQSLPPIAFEIARETKELVQRIDAIEGEAGNDFS